MAPTLAQLQGMKRAELQALCKENGEKANGKTDALIELLAARFGLTEASVAPEEAPAAPVNKASSKTKKASAVATKPKTKKAAPAAPVVEDQSEEADEEEDEMRLGAPEPVKAPVVKSEAVKASKPKVAVAAPAVESTPASSSSEPRVYATSPATKATIKALLSTVQDLQSELKTARSALGQLETTVASLPPPPAPNSPSLKKKDVLALVESKINEYRQEMTKALGSRFSSVEQQLSELKDSLPLAPEEDSEAIQQLQAQVEADLESTKAWKSTLEGSIASLRTDVTTRLDALEYAGPTETIVAQDASPTPSDAPPTQTLASFSSPTPASRAATPASTRVASPAVVPSPATRRASPRKPTSGYSTPALALPSHMVAHISPARPKSPRMSVSTPVAAAPASPARPSTATLGKHARYSDASDLSVGVEMIKSPPAVEGVSASAMKEGGHIRKRMRVSEGSVVDHGDEESSFGDDEDEVEASLMYESRRDFVVQTKTGDEPPVPLSFASAGASISDPSFFSLPSPSASRPQSAPGSSRKFLPMTALPFPLVSPFAGSRVSKSVHGTPATTSASTFSFGNDASNTRRGVPPTPPAAKTLYGTERLYSDGENDGEGSRFEDVAQELGGTPGKWGGRPQSWGGFGVFGAK